MLLATKGVEMRKEMEGFLVAGIALKTDNSRAEEEMGAHYRRFAEEGWAERIPNKVGGELHALYHEYEGDFTEPYGFLLGFRVSSAEGLPEGVTVAKFLPGTYESYDVQGPMPQALIETWMEVWQSDLLRSYKTDLEIHSSDGCELLIGLTE